MIDPRILENEKRLHIALKERIRADDPEIDERTLADTVEGLTDFHEILAELVRAALKDEAEAAVLKVMMGQMADRLQRFEDRAERRRNVVRDVMLAAGLDKLQMPDFTASVRHGARHVVIVDEALIPNNYVEMRRHVRKRELGEALRTGEQIAGAVLNNPSMTLTVRTR